MLNAPLTAIATGLRMMRRPLALAGLLAPGVLLATPTGGVVVAGQASIGTPAGNGLHITQGSHSAVINWQDFSIGTDEYVVFHQPSSSATVLNRVVGGLPSEILGNLSANGRVFLVNPAGVVFGKGAQVDVGGLLASTLDLDDADFMSGRYFLSRPAGSAAAGVSNAGSLTAAPGGFVVLAGDRVSNSGLIQAQLGSVALASGAAVTLGLDAQGLVNFSIDAAALSANAGVENLGDIIANGGRVLLDAQVAQGLVATAVNNRGRLQAQSIEERNGEIHLGARGGDVVQDGLVNASGAAGRDGGTVRIRSDQDIRLGETGEIRFGGANGGDSRLVAGGTLSLAEGSVIDGRAAAGGRGGFLEISGDEGLRSDGELQLGQGGRLLIDPAHLEVAADCTNSTAGACFTSGDIAGQLNSGTDVALIASDRISFASGSSISAYGGASLLLGIGSPETGSYGGEFPNSSGVFGFIRGNASEGNGDILMGANSISTGGSFRAFGGLDTGDVQLGTISAADILIESAGSISTGALNATEAVHATAAGGGISTGNIRVDGIGFGATIDLSARDGISTGDLTAIHRHDGSSDSLSARIAVRGNDHYGTPGSGNVSTGAITLRTVTNGVAGLSANGSINLRNDGQYVSDAYGGSYVGGGSVSTGPIISDIQATAPPAECLPECSTYSYNDIYVSGAGDLQIGGVQTTSNAASEAQEHFLSLHSGNAGTVRTGNLNLGHPGNVYLSSASAQDSSGGSGDVIVGLINGSVRELDIHATGAVTLTSQALVAADIGIASGRGNLVTGNLTATDGGIRLSAEGGAISTGTLSATAAANPFPQESAQTSAFYRSAGVFAEARDGISTGDISVVNTATANDQFLSGQVMLRGTAFADPAVAGGDINTGRISIRTEPGTHQGISGSAYVHLSNHAQIIEDASGVRSVGGGSISTGDIQLTVPATAADASCVDCVSSADAEIYLTAERDISVETVQMRATAPDAAAASSAVLMFSENGGNITTGLIDVGSGGDIDLGSRMRDEGPGTGTIVLGGVAGNAGHVDLFSAGSVRVLQNVTADSISLQAENGNIETAALTATDGSLFLGAHAGRVATGALSATHTQFSTVSVHARDSIATGAVSVTARAADNNQTLDADVVMSLNAGATGATGGDIATGNIRVQTATAGFTGIDASTSVSLSNHAFSSSPSPAATTAKAVAGGIRTGDILLETGGDQVASADVHLFAGRDIGTGAIRFSGAAGSRFLDVATQSGGDIVLGRLDLMPGTTTHLSAFSEAGATDLGNIRLGQISDGGVIDAFATGQLLVDSGTTALRLGNVQFNAANILLRGGSMDLSGTINAGEVLDIRSPGVVTSATGLAVHAGGVAIEAEEIRLAKANFLIGSQSVNLGTDAALLEKLDPARRPQSTGPNAAFQARSGNGVTIGNLDVEGGYIFVRAPGFFSGKIGRGGASTGTGTVSKALSPMLFNLRPGAESDGMDVSNFQASLTQFTVPLDGSVTFAFGGSGQTGDIIASQPIDFGGSSVALQTSGKVAADLIRSTGQVIVIGGTPPPPPVDHETQTETQNVLAATTNTSTYASKQDSADADDERQGSGDEGVSFEMAASSVVDETSGAPAEDLQCK